MTAVRARGLSLPDRQPLAPRLAGAASLRAELEDLLAAAPPDARPAQYRELVLAQNVTGKRSASARLWAWKRLKLRYALDPAVPEFRAFLAGMGATANAAERGLLCALMFARADRLFREVTLECVSPHLAKEGTLIERAPVRAAMAARARARGLEWSTLTLDRASGHLLSALKDDGLVRGSRTKTTARPRPGTAATLFAVRLARLEGLTDRQILEAGWFRLLGLDAEGTVDLLYAAAREGALGFRRQAEVVEIDLPPTEL